MAGTSYCIPVGCVLGSPFITQNDVQVIQITTDVAGGVASTGSVADTGLSVWTMQDSVTQTCGGGGADTCWVGTFTSTYEAASGFNQYTITLSLSAKSSAWLTSCTNCVLSGLVVKHAGSASNSVASVASFSPPTSGLVMATAVIDGASTAGSPWTADAGFNLIPIANGGSFLSPGQGTFSAPYSGGATTAFIVNSAGTGWAEDVIAMGPTPLNSTVGSQTIPFYSVALNATYAVTCYNQGFYYVTNHPTVGYATDGCDYYNPTVYPPPISPNTTPVWSFLIAIPASQAPTGLMTANMPLGYYHIQVFVQPENWDTQFCTNSFFGLDTYYQSQQCINMETWFVTPQNSGLQAGFLTPLLTIIVGLILFLIGCGINLQAGGSIFGNGSSLGAGVNAQGTRLAQVLGLTLVFYTPLYSEFSSWFTQGILPLGLDGNISAIATGSGIMAFIITGLLFVGVAWQALSFGGDA